MEQWFLNIWTNGNLLSSYQGHIRWKLVFHKNFLTRKFANHLLNVDSNILNIFLKNTNSSLGSPQPKPPSPMTSLGWHEVLTKKYSITFFWTIVGGYTSFSYSFPCHYKNQPSYGNFKNNIIRTMEWLQTPLNL